MFHNVVNRVTFVIGVLVVLFLIGIDKLRDRQEESMLNLSHEGQKRTETLLKNNLELLSQNILSYTYDYTYWDDMVKFVEKRNLKWAEVNIASSLSNFKINYAWVLDKNFVQIYSNNTLNEIRYQKFPLDAQKVREIFLKEKFPHFFIKTDNYLFEIAGAPIQFSVDIERKGVPHGYFLTGRIWDETYLNSVGRINFSNVSIINPSDYLTIDKNNPKAIRPEIMTVKVPLKNYNHDIIYYLYSKHVDKAIEGMLRSYEQQLPTWIFIGAVVLLAIAVSLIIWVVLPIKVLSNGLVFEETERLEQLAKSKTEFGDFAKLLIEFFNQKGALKKEIAVRKRTEEELVIAKEKAEEATKIKTAFFSNMSHELRTPMIGILGFAETITSENKDPETVHMAKLIHKSGKRLIDTLNKVLDLSRLDADRQELNLSVINLSEFVYETFVLFEKAALQKNLSYTFSTDSKKYFAKLNEEILKDTLNNLINNAIKFTFTGGIDVSIKGMNEWIVISVKDTGIGIPNESLSLIFDEFRQVSEGIDRNFEGTGLGLALVKKYVEILKGKITVESEIGKGSRFILKIPMTEQREVQIPQINHTEIALPKQPQAVDRLKPILVVEDDLITREVILVYLKNKYVMDMAKNEEEVLSQIKERDYFAILMDINLGRGGNGVEITKKVKQSSRNKNTPVIAATAFAMKGDREEFLAAGCDYYISKPYSKEEILSVLATIETNQETSLIEK